MQDRARHIRQIMPVRCRIDGNHASILAGLAIQFGVYRDPSLFSRPVRHGNRKLSEHLVQRHVPVFCLCRAALCGDCLQKLACLLVQRIDEHEQLIGAHTLRHKQNAAIELHHRNELGVFHPTELEHSVRNDGVAVPFNNLEFHMNLLLHSTHLYFFRWG